MSRRCFKGFVVIAVLLAASSMLFAATINVTPSNMQGWVTARFGDATRCGFYVAPPGGPAGSGTAFYASTGEWSISGDVNQVPNQVWLGTDALVGVAIKDITKLNYSTFTYQRGIDNSHFASQPIQLQIIVQKSATNTAKRVLMYRPWGLFSTEEIINGFPNPWGKWETHEAHRTMSNLTHIDASDGNNITRWGRWYVANGDQIGHTWDELANPSTGILKDAIICDADQAFGWDGGTIPAGDPVKTGTGCGFNFTVGGRKNVTNIFTESGYNWSRECWNFAGYVTNFTIGINGVDTTYTFQDNVRTGKYAIGGKTAKSSAVAVAQNKHKFVVYGRVKTLLKTPAANNIIDRENFEVNDKSGTVIRVHTTTYDPTLVPNNSYVRVEGVIDPSVTPITLYTQESGIKVFPN